MHGKPGALLAASIMLGFTAGCGGGGGSGGMAAPVANVTGDWTVTLTRAAADNDCTNDLWNHGTFPIPLTVDHPQGSNGFTVTNAQLSISTTGTLDGDKMDFAATADLPVYCQSLDVQVDLTVTASGGSAAGIATWTCHNGGTSCSGTDTVNAVRN